MGWEECSYWWTAKKWVNTSIDVTGEPVPRIHVTPDEDWETAIREAPAGALIHCAPGVYVKKVS